MVVPLKFTFTTTAVPARALKQIQRTTNRAVGEYVVEKVLPGRFTNSIAYEIPGVFQRRSKKYEARKLRRVGHNIPNVLTGALKNAVLGGGSKVTATANGGRVYIKGPRPMREQQRAELEAVSKRQIERMAAHAAKVFEREINDPKNMRKRSVRKGKG